MTAILHRIELRESPRHVYDALSTTAGLAAWWTPMVETDARVGGEARFRFGDGEHGPDMRITELQPGERVAWHCERGPWQGHDFVFDIRPGPKGAVLLFSHSGWAAADEFFMHCNSKWGYFLGVSLKSLVETGTGAPHPQDPDL